MTTQPQFVDGAWQDPPELIDTVIAGVPQQYPVAGLKRRIGWHEDEDETCNWVEYRLDEAVVHRSVDMRVKKAIFADGAAAASF